MSVLVVFWFSFYFCLRRERVPSCWARNMGVGVFFLLLCSCPKAQDFTMLLFFLWLNANFLSQHASVHLLPVTSQLSPSFFFPSPSLFSGRSKWVLGTSAQPSCLPFNSHLKQHILNIPRPWLRSHLKITTGRGLPTIILLSECQLLWIFCLCVMEGIRCTRFLYWNPYTLSGGEHVMLCETCLKITQCCLWLLKLFFPFYTLVTIIVVYE